MKPIPLSKRGKNKGKYFAEVDDHMYPFLIHWNWRAVKMGKTIYALRTTKTENGHKVTILMHRFILGETNPKIDVDHKNRNGLCNMECNLRTCTKQQNQFNRNGWENSFSKYKGVRYITNIQKRIKRWTTSITINRKALSF